VDAFVRSLQPGGIWEMGRDLARGGDHGRGGADRGRIWEALLAWPGTEGGRGWGSPSWEAGRARTTTRWMGSGGERGDGFTG
jgi:hypothetical protein